MADPQLLTDLRLDLIDNRALSIYRVGEARRRLTSGGRGVRVRDFALATGRQNLAQALIARLLTPQGELAALGHPSYGSRLHEVIGQPNTETTRNLARLFVIDAVKQERRVAEIVAIEVTPHPVERVLVLIALEVLPVGEDTVLAVRVQLEL